MKSYRLCKCKKCGNKIKLSYNNISIAAWQDMERQIKKLEDKIRKSKC